MSPFSEKLVDGMKGLYPDGVQGTPAVMLKGTAKSGDDVSVSTSADSHEQKSDSASEGLHADASALMTDSVASADAERTPTDDGVVSLLWSPYKAAMKRHIICESAKKHSAHHLAMMCGNSS